MTIGRLHAKSEGLETCALPFVNEFCDFYCFHYRKTIEKGQNLDFHQKSAYALASLMSSHTDQVERRKGDPFKQFRQYSISLQDQKGENTRIN